jgi:hypothetical protein
MGFEVARKINPDYLRRANRVSNEQIGSYMESIVISLHAALDDWRYNNAPTDEVTTCVDALVAMWSSVESRSNE